jgi:hypothetical protein
MKNKGFFLYTIFFFVFFQGFSVFSADFEQPKADFEQPKADFDDFLDALSWVESSHNDRAIGDGGRSIGRYQITKLYFIDAQKQEAGLGNNTWEDCFDPEVAKIVVRAYMSKYEPSAVRNKDWETLARLHNSGPDWRSKKYLTNKYWNKVKIRLEMGN